MKEEIAQDVVQVPGTGSAFAAVKTGGSVVTWGYAEDGGNSGTVTEERLRTAGCSGGGELHDVKGGRKLSDRQNGKTKVN